MINLKLYEDVHKQEVIKKNKKDTTPLKNKSKRSSEFKTFYLFRSNFVLTKIVDKSKESLMCAEEFSNAFEALKDRKFHNMIKDSLLKFLQKNSRAKLTDIELSNDYFETKGNGGYERNKIYTFSGIKLTDGRKKYLIKKGDFWNLPKKAVPQVSQIFGFELNIDPDNCIEEAYFITRN